MNLFVEISLIIVFATAVAGVMRTLRQPLIMGHILTGLLVGPLVFGFVHATETLEIFSEFGVSILLFIVGLHLSPKIVKDVGKVAVIAGAGQIMFTAGFGFLLSKLFGFTNIQSLYIAIAIAFSSTIIVLKLLSDRKDIEKLYAKISIGILLVQDVAAIVALIFVATFSNGGGAASTVVLLLAKGAAFTILIALISTKLLPKLSDFFATSQEFLFLFAIGWGLGLASMYSILGFSIEIGALLAGIALSVSPYSQEISARLTPLRDFFVIMFFVFLGAQMTFPSLSAVILPIIVLSLFVLIFNPFIVVLLTSLLGYNKKTAFMTGVSMAQISEFSLILALLGVSVGHIGADVLSLITLIALVTIAASTYMINYADNLYPHFIPILSVFERKRPKQEYDILGYYDVILFGCNRAGYDFLHSFKELGQSFLVVDFDPETVRDLAKDGINVRFGDAEDADFLEELNLGEAKMIISTIPDFDANEFMLKKAKAENSNVVVILLSHNVDEALDLYKFGANYVILPYFTGGQFAADLAHKRFVNNERFKEERNRQVKYLKKRASLGHKHPKKGHWHT